MPYYDYECVDCGPFTELKPMAQSDQPGMCPSCGEEAPRAFLRMPSTALMDGARRTAFATNERSRHEPKTSKKSGHGAGCSCCGGKGKSSSTLYRPDGSKSFPSKRPWMIGH
ncbi:MAG: FmdB family zinc ribbon protein [Flavobacteriaceae bacterium]